MAKIFWKSGRTVGFVIGLLILYLIVRAKRYEHKAFVFIPKVHPNEVWEFVADFSNMKYLNPTITDFNIIDESGNYRHWKYSVEYSENLSHWPYLSNHAIAHFDIKESNSKNNFFIHSNHQTCLFMGLYCLYTDSEFKFSHGNSSKGAECEETVNYQCPIILSSFCRREVVYQRNAIINNLRKKFASRTT